MTVISQLSGNHQALIRLSYDSHQAIFRQSPGNSQAVNPMDPWITAQTLRQTLANRGILLDRLFSTSSVLLNPLYKFKMHLRVLDGFKEGTEVVEKAGDIEVLLLFALDTKYGFDAHDVLQKYFINADQLSLTNQELLQNLRSGASKDVETAREDVLARLKTLHEEWLKELFENGTLHDHTAEVFHGFKSETVKTEKNCIIM